eukprot:Nk52_evm43s1671 gene=Nk52_evmTU43s1671
MIGIKLVVQSSTCSLVWGARGFASAVSTAAKAKPIVVLKVGGAVVSKELPHLVKAVGALKAKNLQPVVVHGGGPQLNTALAEAKIEPKYHKGMRITDKATLDIAVDIFGQENDKIVKGLESAGIAAKPLKTGVLEADFLNFDIWKHVGKVKGVHKEGILKAMNEEHVPVVSSLAFLNGDESAMLNVNADTAACQTALALKPKELIFVNTTGGLKIDGVCVPEICVYKDSDKHLLNPTVMHGTRLKIVEISDLLCKEPVCSSVSLLGTKDLVRHIDQMDSKSYDYIEGSTRFYRSMEFQEDMRMKHAAGLKTVGIVGARGYVGKELISMIVNHPMLELACVSSRQLQGTPIKDSLEFIDGKSPTIDKNENINMMRVDPKLADAKLSDMPFVNISPDDIVERYGDVDCWVLALPNNLSKPFVDKIVSSEIEKMPIIVDLSADNRFDDSWTYGFPERYRESIKRAKKISNPGCYATGAQVSLLPLIDIVQSKQNPLAEKIKDIKTPHVFGVSGYSGAGTSPSPNNDPENLKNNLLPYKLVDHIHENEVTRQLGRNIYFTPHVASHFRGISITTSVPYEGADDLTSEDIYNLYASYYVHEPLVDVIQNIPFVKQNANEHHVTIGGFAVDSKKKRIVVTVTLDNLLKGAATQAMQNINIALGFKDELMGIPQ